MRTFSHSGNIKKCMYGSCLLVGFVGGGGGEGGSSFLRFLFLNFVVVLGGGGGFPGKRPVYVCETFSSALSGFPNTAISRRLISVLIYDQTDHDTF